MEQVTVIGAGAWGTALALQALRAGSHVRLWARDPARAAEIAATRHNPRLPAATLPPDLEITADLSAAAGLRLLVVPMQHLRGVIARLPRSPAPLVVCAKGLETGTLRLPLELIAELHPGTPAAVLTGPNFAHEVAAGLPAAAVVAATDPDLRDQVAARLSTPTFRLYGNDDPVGAQVGGAAKNVIAIAAGAVIGAGLGENARAALITRGLAELARLATALGGRRETVMGLSGLGDLLLTCTGPVESQLQPGRGAGPRRAPGGRAGRPQRRHRGRRHRPCPGRPRHRPRHGRPRGHADLHRRRRPARRTLHRARGDGGAAVPPPPRRIAAGPRWTASSPRTGRPAPDSCLNEIPHRIAGRPPRNPAVTRLPDAMAEAISIWLPGTHSCATASPGCATRPPMLRSVLTVGGWTMVSRVLGFARDMLIAAMLGAGPIADAFFVALKLPNLFRRLFGEGAFNAAFVPAFSGMLTAEGPDTARRFAEQAFSVMVVSLGVLTVVGEIFMPQVITVLAPGFVAIPAKFKLAVTLSRITFPYLILICLAALVAGMLNGLDRFTAASASYVLFNVVSIASLLWLTPYVPTAGHALAWGDHRLRRGAAWGCCCGRCGGPAWRSALPRPRLTPQIRLLLRRMAPGLVGAGRDATEPGDRRDHRQPAARRHRVAAVLRRPGAATAAGGDRHRGRHGAAADAVAPGARRRGPGGARHAEPGDRIRAVPHAAGGGGADRSRPIR